MGDSIAYSSFLGEELVRICHPLLERSVGSRPLAWALKPLGMRFLSTLMNQLHFPLHGMKSTDQSKAQIQWDTHGLLNLVTDQSSIYFLVGNSRLYPE